MAVALIDSHWFSDWARSVILSIDEGVAWPLPPVGMAAPFQHLVPWVARELSRHPEIDPAWIGSSLVDLTRMFSDWALDSSHVDGALALKLWRNIWKSQQEFLELQDNLYDAPVIPGRVVAAWADGASIQELTTQEQLRQEGESMNHCVGGLIQAGVAQGGGHYWQETRDGKGRIFSYRGKDCIPEATIYMTGQWTGGGEAVESGASAEVERATPWIETLEVCEVQGRNDEAIEDEKAQKRVAAWLLSLVLAPPLPMSIEVLERIESPTGVILELVIDDPEQGRRHFECGYSLWRVSELYDLHSAAEERTPEERAEEEERAELDEEFFELGDELDGLDPEAQQDRYAQIEERRADIRERLDELSVEDDNLDGISGKFKEALGDLADHLDAWVNRVLGLLITSEENAWMTIELTDKLIDEEDGEIRQRHVASYGSYTIEVTSRYRPLGSTDYELWFEVNINGGIGADMDLVKAVEEALADPAMFHGDALDPDELVEFEPDRRIQLEEWNVGDAIPWVSLFG
jgi:hypothetical protein